MAFIRIAEEPATSCIQGLSEIGRDAPVDGAFIAEQFSAENKAGIAIDAEGHARREAAQTAADPVPETAGVFGHGIEPVGQDIAQRFTDIRFGTEETAAAGLQGERLMVAAIGLFADAIDDAAGTAAAENHRIRSFQHFHLADVIEVPEVLDVVTDAIREEIAGAGIAAHHRGITVSFALRHADARHIAQDIRHAMQGLVVDLLLGHDGNRLRGVFQCRFGFHGAARVAGLIPEREAFDLDLVQNCRVFRAGVGGGRQGHGQAEGEESAWVHVEFDD